jgi:hypothetical protein
MERTFCSGATPPPKREQLLSSTALRTKTPDFFKKFVWFMENKLDNKSL